MARRAAGLALGVRQRLERIGAVLLLGFLLAAGAIYAFATLARGVLLEESWQLDLVVLEWTRANRSPALDVAARGFEWMGSQVVGLLTVILAVLLGRRRRWGALAGLLLTVIGMQVLNDVLKETFQRARPGEYDAVRPAQSFSFPSGHAMVAGAFYLYLGYLGWRALGDRQGALWLAGMVALVLLIGLSRLYLGVHYASDVVAGYSAGLLWTDAVIVATTIWQRRRAGRSIGTAAPTSPVEDSHPRD